MNPRNHKELKEWQKSLNIEARQKFTKNFIDSLMIINFSTWFIFQKYLSLFDKMENEAYEKSESRAEYYCKLAQETYKIYDLIRDENSLLENIEQLNLNDQVSNVEDNYLEQAITNKDDLVLIEDCIKSNLVIIEDCTENCNHVKCLTKRNILRHLISCTVKNCNTPFCNASKQFLKQTKTNIVRTSQFAEN